MIKYEKRDITTVTKGIVGHGVNCQGRMGSGVAAAVKHKWPIVYDNFIHDYNEGYNILGTTGWNKINEELHIVNMYTQEYYGYDLDTKYASLDAIENCLIGMCLTSQYTQLGIYIPKVGCGLGGLDWETEVKPLLKKKFNKCDITVCEL